MWLKTAWGLTLFLVIQEGFEPPTHGLEGRCSIQLGYWTIAGLRWLHTTYWGSYWGNLFSANKCPQRMDTIKPSRTDNTLYHNIIALAIG